MRPARTLIPGGRFDNIDLVLVRESQRDALLAYLDRVAAGETLDPPVRVRRVHSVRIAGEPASFEHFHLDDKRWPKELPEPEAGDRRIPAVELGLRLAVDVVVPG